MTPHQPLLTLWDLAPVPVICGDRLRVTVGAKCPCGCNLADEVVRILDSDGQELQAVPLGDTPLPGTRGLYWADLTLPAPEAEGAHTWAVRCQPRAHLAATARLAFTTTLPAQHSLTVRLRDTANLCPLPGAEVRAGSFRAITDATGVARLRLPPGSFRISAWQPGYRASPVKAVLPRDTQIDLTATALPQDDPLDIWC